MKFKYYEDLGPQSDFWHLLTQGYLDPLDLCASGADADAIVEAVQILEGFKYALEEAGILNEC